MTALSGNRKLWCGVRPRLCNYKVVAINAVTGQAVRNLQATERKHLHCLFHENRCIAAEASQKNMTF